jgi:hypothetical protein
VIHRFFDMHNTVQLVNYGVILDLFKNIRHFCVAFVHQLSKLAQATKSLTFSERSRFELRSGHPITWLKTSWFYTVPSGKCRDNTSDKREVCPPLEGRGLGRQCLLSCSKTLYILSTLLQLSNGGLFLDSWYIFFRGTECYNLSRLTIRGKLDSSIYMKIVNKIQAL